MGRSGFGLVTALAAALVLQAPVHAEDAAPPAPAGWDELVEGLRALPSRLLARLPEAERNDPQVQQEVARLALEALTSSALDTLGGDGDHPTFIPQIGQTLNVGQPNADTVYRTARITPGGSYRLRGRRGSVRLFKIAQVPPNMGEGGGKPTQVGAMRLTDDFNTLHVDAEGRFDVILSPERPAGYAGDWWRLDPIANKLLLRIVNSDWGHEQDPTVSIERVDIPVERQRPTAADLEKRLRRLPAATTAIAGLFVDHVTTLRSQGYVNKLKVLDVSQAGGLAGQFYYEGDYDLGADEALIIEAKVPARCAYRSLILTNELYETSDWTNNQGSLNDAQAKPDADGVLRAVVSAKDPGVPNWLDTGGYPQGLVQGRWTDCDSQPIPTVRKVPLADVRKFLPPETPVVTPAAREEAVRERRSAYLQRALW